VQSGMRLLPFVCVRVHAYASACPWYTCAAGERLLYVIVQMQGSSAYNNQEGQVILRLFRSLLRNGITAERIGIITPYRGQVQHLQRLFRTGGFDEATLTATHIGTVDAFQGGERDVILVSTVCAGQGGPGPHVTNAARLNVTISRARHHLVIVGCVVVVATHSLTQCAQLQKTE
jgi:superfamily I DNA and/or RNA helicase